jgi:phosphohistidine phosphatase
MRQLLLLRHAKSSWDEPHLSDHARPLNMRGNQAAAAMAREMRRLGLLPDLVPASDLLDALRNAAPTARCVLLVGHNPGLHDLAMMLAGVQRGSTDKDIQRLANGYPSGALSEFTVDVPWTMLGKTGVRLTRLLLPSDLSEVRA